MVQLTSRLQWRPKNWKNQNKWRLFAKKNITELEKSLVGVKLDYDELLSAINKANLDEYFFNNISAEEVVKVILGEVDDE